MTTDPTYSSRTYGFNVHAPETLNDPISKALNNAVPVSPPRTKQRELITDGKSGGSNNNNQVALAAPTRSIEIIGGRSRFVDDEDVETIVDAWLDPEKDPSDVKLIDLSLNKISSRGLLNLVKAIGERPGQLKDLDINSNNLNDEALKSISTHLLGNPNVQIERYDLSTNKFTDDGVITFITSLRARGASSPVRTLLLRQNDLTNKSLKVICEYLKDPNCSLTSCHISGNDYTELDGIKWIAEVIATNKSLIDFNVSNSFDYVARWEPIVDAITNNNTTLRQFNIAVMGKKPEALVPADEILKKNRIRALSQESEIDRLKKVHAKEIENLKAVHSRREAELENKIAKLLAELEKIQGSSVNGRKNADEEEKL